MSLTRRDFEKVADIIRHAKETYELDGPTLASVAESLATYFGACNPNFNEERFNEACGRPDGEWAV